MRRSPCQILMCFVTGLALSGLSDQSSMAGGGEIQRLPVTEDYQRVLRDHLAGLTAADFTVPDAPFYYDDDFLADPDNLFRTWLALNDGYGLSTRGIYDLAPEAYTLARIESPEGTRLRSRASLFAASLLFFSDWDYPGNPLFNSRELRNRVLAFCIVDMLNLDALHRENSPESHRIRRSDYLGGTLAWHAMTYARMKDELPPEVAAAFEQGLSRFVDRLLAWGAPGGLGNMTSKGLVAHSHIERAASDPDLAERSRQAAREIISVISDPAGFITDGGGTDISYNGIAIYHMAWAARLSGWDFLDDAVRRLLRFQNVLILPEPDGKHWGPTHFSVRTSGDAANDQWAFNHRQYGLALGWPDLAGHLIFEGHRAPRLPDEDRMRHQIRQRLNGLSRAIDSAPETVQEQAAPWAPEHWDVRYNWAWQFYEPGGYALLRQAEAERSDWTRTPMHRYPAWSENLAGEVVLRRSPSHAAIVHAGRIGRWREHIYGLGGGALSAFWTPAGGSLLLGRRRGFQHDNRDRLDEWRIWPVHALSGETTAGKVFTSARVRFPEKTIEEHADGTVHIRLTGEIGDALSAPDDALRAPIRYVRDFVLDDEGVTYRIRVDGDGLAEAAELFETIPVFLRDARRQPDVETHIVFLVDGEEVPATDEPVWATGFRVRRFMGGAQVAFTRPRLIQLSPTVWRDTYQSRAEQRNVMVAMTPGIVYDRDGPVTLEFAITPMGAAEPEPEAPDDET